METCRGVEPRQNAFAARFAQPELHVKARNPPATGAGGGNRTPVTGLEDQGLTIRPQPRGAHSATTARSRIPESNRNRTDTNGEHDRRADAAMLVESLGNAPRRPACKTEQQPSASDPEAGLQGIAPRSGVLEAPLRLSLRPKKRSRCLPESNRSHLLDREAATPVASSSKRAGPARAALSSRIEREGSV